MKKIYTKKAPEPIGPYSQAIVYGKLIFCSGQIAVDPKSKQMVKNDIKLQTRQILNNISEVLKASGSNLQKIIKNTVYLSDMNDFPEFNQEYEIVFNKHKPARSTIESRHLPRQALIEIESIAAK